MIVRRKLSYEWWYVVHLLAYAGIALAWFHQIPTGNELVLDRTAANYWRALYVATIVVLVVFRLLAPARRALRYRLRVAEVTPEGPGVVSVRITGRNLDRLRAQAGQFFLWRFLDGERWCTAHPFSLSEAPDGARCGSPSRRSATTPRGSASCGRARASLAEGPFGVFTDAARRARQGAADRRRHRHHAGPRAAREMRGDLVVALPRDRRADDVIFRDELDRIAAARGATVHYVRRRPRAATAPTCSRPRTSRSSSRTSTSATSSSAARPR